MQASQTSPIQSDERELMKPGHFRGETSEVGLGETA